MSEARQSVRLDEIHVPEDRLRPLDEEHARMLAVSVGQHGVLQPITVYRSSRREGKPYTLIFGLHRHRAAEIAGLEEIEAVFRTKDEARALEIAENLFRHDLSVLDRAAFSSAWFEANGIRPGRKAKPAKLAELFPGRDLSERVAEELGFSGRKAQRLRQIGRDLHSELREALRGTPAENNQDQLLKLAKRPPREQVTIAKAVRSYGFEVAWKAFKEATSGRMERTDWLETRLVDCVNRMSREQRDAVLSRLGYMRKPLDELPAHLPPLLPIAAPGNLSPLWATVSDPLALARPLTHAESLDASKAYARAELDAKARALAMLDTIKAQQAEALAEAKRQEKAKASKRRRKGPGRPAKTPEQKRSDAFHGWFGKDLAEALLQRPEATINHPQVKYCRKLDEQARYWAACHLGNGHDLEDIRAHVEWKREREHEAAAAAPEED